MTTTTSSNRRVHVRARASSLSPARPSSPQTHGRCGSSSSGPRPAASSTASSRSGVAISGHMPHNPKHEKENGSPGASHEDVPDLRGEVRRGKGPIPPGGLQGLHETVRSLTPHLDRYLAAQERSRAEMASKRAMTEEHTHRCLRCRRMYKCRNACIPHEGRKNSLCQKCIEGASKT